MRVATAAAIIASAAPAVLAADCPSLEFVFARATTEPPQGIAATDSRDVFEKKIASDPKLWSKGYGAAGYSLYTNVTQLIPTAHGTAVNYPASMGGMDKGVTDMITVIKDISEKCPQTKFAIGGHSQGGMVTVAAVKDARFVDGLLNKVVAVTMFGAPACPDKVKDKCKSYCNKGDFVCDAAGGSKGAGGSAKGMGGMSKGMGGMPKGMGAPPKEVNGTPKSASSAPPKDVSSAPPAGGHDMAGMAGMSGMVRRAADAECSSDVPERGREAKGSNESPHLLYNKDGYYVKAAACYIKQKLDAAK